MMVRLPAVAITLTGGNGEGREPTCICFCISQLGFLARPEFGRPDLKVIALADQQDILLQPGEVA